MKYFVKNEKDLKSKILSNVEERANANRESNENGDIKLKNPQNLTSTPEITSNESTTKPKLEQIPNETHNGNTNETTKRALIQFSIKSNEQCHKTLVKSSNSVTSTTSSTKLNKNVETSPKK